MQNLVKKETLREDLEGILLTRYEETDDSLYTYSQNLNVRLQTLEEMKALIIALQEINKDIKNAKVSKDLKRIEIKVENCFCKSVVLTYVESGDYYREAFEQLGQAHLNARKLLLLWVEITPYIQGEILLLESLKNLLVKQDLNASHQRAC